MTSAINQADIEYLRAITAPRTASDFCLAIAEYIREHGWCQHALSDASGAVCAAGAHQAVGAPPIAWLAFVRVVTGGEDGNEGVAWNDAPERTKADVIAAWMLAGMNLKRRGE